MYGDSFMKIVTIFLFALLSLLSINSHATFKDEQLIYAQLLQSQNLSAVKLGAKALHHQLPYKDEALWDLTAYTLWRVNTLSDRDDNQFGDTNAWLIRALTEYNNPKYRSMLVKLLKAKQPGKIRRYLKKALKKLAKGSKNPFIPNTYQVDNIKAIEKNNLVTEKEFEQITMGTSLSSVRAQLGQPEGAGQYRNKMLRITYFNIGSMAFKYNRNEWILVKTYPQAMQDISNADRQNQDILSQLISDDARQIRIAAKDAILIPLADPQALDHVAQFIWDNRYTEDKYMIDSLAWLCKVLWHSNNGRYKTFLATLASSDIDKKIAHYAEGSAEKLPFSASSYTPLVKM